MDTIPPWAVRGAKVVCIKRGQWSPTHNRPEPVFGGVYEIIEVISRPAVIYLALTGFPLDMFDVRQFRPSITEPDDLAKFQHLLTPTPEERVDALLSDLNDQWSEDEEVQAARLARDAANGRCF